MRKSNWIIFKGSGWKFKNWLKPPRTLGPKTMNKSRVPKRNMGEITPKTEGNVGSHGSGWWLTSGWAIPTFAAFVPHAPMADPAGKNPLRTPRWLRGLVTIPVRARNYEKDIVPMFFRLFRNILTPPKKKKGSRPRYTGLLYMNSHFVREIILAEQSTE